MVIFEDISDVEDWLAPLDYVAFWEAVEPFEVFTDVDRDHCDALIAGGKVRQDAVLVGLKTMARVSLTIRFNLTDRIYEPVDRQYLMTTH
ncbi:MAG: hypothetical protein AAGK02_00765 [Pseudomonadota bacterium]